MSLLRKTRQTTLDISLLLLFVLAICLLYRISTEDFRPERWLDIGDITHPTGNGMTISNVALWTSVVIFTIFSFVFIQQITKSFTLAYVHFFLLTLGSLGVGLLNYSAKKTISRLRPDALNKCLDISNGFKVQEEYSIKEYWITQFPSKCVSSKSFNESFFSGHAAHIFYASDSLVLLVNEYMMTPFSWLFTVTIVAWEYSVAYSRVVVGRHHSLDVFVGIVMGKLMAYFIWGEYLRYINNNTEDPGSEENLI